MSSNPRRHLARLIYLVGLGLHDSGQTVGGLGPLGPARPCCTCMAPHLLVRHDGLVSGWRLGLGVRLNTLVEDVVVCHHSRGTRVPYPRHRPPLLSDRFGTMLFGILSMATCRSRMGGRGHAPTAHIPITLLLRRHWMSATPPTPRSSVPGNSSRRPLLGRRWRRRATASFDSITMRRDGFGQGEGVHPMVQI